MNVVLRLMKAAVEFVWLGGWVGWWGLESHFPVQPNYSVEVLLSLCCVFVGFVTKVITNSWEHQF